MEFAELSLQELLRPQGFDCSCGRHHTTGLRAVQMGGGALKAIPQAMREANIHKPFLVSDANTDAVAGEAVRRILDEAHIPYHFFTFLSQEGPLEPDECAVGAICMAYPPGCDGVVAVGSGVLNDCCKVAAHAFHVPCGVVATAPSMDGYASDNASMVQNHVKTSLYNACPTFVLGDTEVLSTAPEVMLKAGLGDMLAKYISVCEWRISHLITGEYYCENIAGLVRASLVKIRSHAAGLLRREEGAICSVMEGLVLSGVAMSFAEISRPASGLEHYFSHLWEMKALEGKLPHSLHGTQVGVGTCLTLRLYEHMRTLAPSRAKAEEAMAAFSPEAWEEQVYRIFGPVAGREVIAREAQAHKNDPGKHRLRLDRILGHWEDIQQIIAQELPRAQEIITLMEALDMPTTPQEIGISRPDMVDAFLGSRDIRDKYLTSSLLWDLGELEDFIQYL